jgi:hypothetical protein
VLIFRTGMVNQLDPIDVRVRLTVDDLYQLRIPIKSSAIRIGASLFASIFALVMVVLAIMAATHNARAWPVLIDLLPLFALAMVIPFISFVLPFLFAREDIKNPNLNGESLYSFTGEGVQMNGTTAKASFTWQALIQACETKNAFLLYPSKDVAIILPKRCFPTQGSIAGFRTLISERIARVQLPS